MTYNGGEAMNSEIEENQDTTVLDQIMLKLNDKLDTMKSRLEDQSVYTIDQLFDIELDRLNDLVLEYRQVQSFFRLYSKLFQSRPSEKD